MATEDEIRARVEAADQARIQVRADIAAKVATLFGKQAQLRDELSETESLLAAALVESDSVMTRAELSTFTGVEDAQLRPDAATETGRQRSRKSAGTRKSRQNHPKTPASPIAISSDF
ncbi:MAG TPA: hypothetical protein VIU87_04310 [Mycobacterium sp.]